MTIFHIINDTNISNVVEMTRLNDLLTKQHFVVIILVFALFNIFLLNSFNQTHKHSETIVPNNEISETTVPFVTRIENDEVSETTVPSQIQIENDTVPKNITNSWLDYNNNWDGEMLVINHPRETKVTLTNDYRMKMKSKGLHPLNLKYKHLRDRIERIDEYCDISLSGSDADFKIIGFYSVLFNDQSQLMQCLTPKVYSSGWAFVFTKMVWPKIQNNLVSKSLEWRNISMVYNLDDTKLTAQRFQTYTKFMISRQPFQRLLSAHRHKFRTDQSWNEERYAPEVITANYLSNYSKEFITETRRKLKDGLIRDSSSEVVRQIARLDAGFQKFNITFLEFLKYIIFFSRTSGAFNLDNHWKPTSLLCNPCAVKYDVIGKFETLSEDSQAILDFVHPNIPEFVYEFQKVTPHITSITCDEAFRKIPLEVRRSLYHIYKDDFLLFDYEYNEDESANLC